MVGLNENHNLTGQVAIVTGAARGIGAECAYALARNGANVVIVDLLPANEIINQIKKDFPNCETDSYQIDIRKREEVQQVINGSVNRWGRIDIVVNNAGTCGRIGLDSMTDEAWSRDLDTNLGGTFLFTQLAIHPHMINQGYGKVVNVSSISGIMGGPTSNHAGLDSGRSGPAYAASKGAVIAFSKWVAKEVGKHGITCNSVAPGAVESEMTKSLNYPLDNQPIKRMGTAEDIAEAVVYLASPASNYVTGQVIKVCGGLAIG
ncbi:3-oxoacyl-[acyl-carrier protein] reductase [Bacillus pakistanensis]|uniref:3-oxoacyl-[acyl-carrier protein] reductase n=1 Tax=Rossellomorea pakistanensis TaxID=992288 RepID=A0ABS2NHC3_9BACI|nr:SDR family NAD(P)-dependent oxidoreductase [Bacillus pakistanensis]MBM7587164.1 3-oxoacyl-[acyl-carrier protein] reductase [Bacillus pakistanensis]